MIVTFATLVTLTAVCSLLPDPGLNLVEQQYEDDSYTETRGKRSLIGVGTRALRTLLKRTARIQSSYMYDKKYKNHMKRGDFQTALKDFESVNPESVKTKTTRSGVKVITGVVGDKKLKLRTPGYKFNSDAVLDVIDIGKREPNKPYIDSIIYTKKPYAQNY